MRNTIVKVDIYQISIGFGEYKNNYLITMFNFRKKEKSDCVVEI